MNKWELIRAISQEINLPLSQDKIAMILNKSIEITGRILETGESVKWSGFGSLIVKEISPKRLYAPKQGKYITSKGSKRIVFKESRKRKNSLPE